MKAIKRIIIWILALFVGSSVLAVAAYRFIPVYITPLMVIRAIDPQGSEKQQERERHWKHQWVSLDEISQWMPRAVIASEDNRFYEHSGFDVKEIKKAIEESKKGKRNRGASTISQQTAKNVFLWPNHSWVRKGLETYFTFLIELMWSKDRIMEVYLNSIEMGGGIYGVEAASQYYFNCPASKLTKRQAALIAVSLPAPLRFDPAHPSGYLNKRVATISRWM